MTASHQYDSILWSGFIPQGIQQLHYQPYVDEEPNSINFSTYGSGSEYKNTDHVVHDIVLLDI